MFETTELMTPAILGLTAIAALLVGFAKGGFGGAFAAAAVPVMTLGMPPLLAVSLLLPVLCIVDAFTVRAYWGKWDRRSVLILIPAAMVGIAIGALAVRYVSSDWLRGAIGLIAVLFACRELQTRLLPSTSTPDPMGTMAGRFWGMVGGFTSHVAHAGGVPLAIWLLSQRLDRVQFVATSAVFFIFVNYAKLVPYTLNGQFSTGVLAVALCAAPLALLGVWLGVRLNKFIPDRFFFPVVAIALLATGLKLISDSATALMG